MRVVHQYKISVQIVFEVWSNQLDRILKFYLFLVAMDLQWCVQDFSSCGKLGLLLLSVPGFSLCWLLFSLFLIISWSLLKFIYIALVMQSSISSSDTLFILLPSIFPRDFSSQSAVHIRWLKYWSFSFSISPSNEYSWLISLKINWFDLLAVQGTFKSLL